MQVHLAFKLLIDHCPYILVNMLPSASILSGEVASLIYFLVLSGKVIGDLQRANIGVIYVKHCEQHSGLVIDIFFVL